jgi:small subunit ribosomal protein S1
MTQAKNQVKNIIATKIVLPKKGSIVEGRVIGRGPACVYIDLSPLGTGIIFGKEYYLAKNIINALKPGDKITAKIVELDNEEGFIELSLTEAQQEMGWEKLKELKESFQTITIKPTGANKGGLLAELYGVKGFLPLSQLSIEHYPRVEDGNTAEILRHLQKLVSKELKVKIIDVDPKENKLIFSERAAESKALQEMLKNYKPGDIVEGVITGLADFGAFIKFPLIKDEKKKTQGEKKEGPTQLEGLIHISELSWQLINDPSEIVKVGDIVKAKIVDISKDGRVSLSLKALEKDPWEGLEKKFKVGDVVSGKVVKINQIGAFVEVAPKIRGLVHISEIGSEAKEVLEEGKSYKFKIISFNPKEHRLTLKPKF